MRIGVILSLVFTILISCSHKNAPVEPGKQNVDQANKIILSVDKGPKESYQNVIQYLSAEGFRIHVRDASSLDIQTAYKPISLAEGTRSFIRINASVIDTTVYFYGQISSGSLDKEIKNEKNNQEAWQELVEIAEGYPHDEIYFSKN